MRACGLVGLSLLATEISFVATGKGLINRCFSSNSQAITPPVTQPDQPNYFILCRHRDANDALKIQEEIRKLKSSGRTYSQVYLEGPVSEEEEGHLNKRLTFIFGEGFHGPTTRASCPPEFINKIKRMGVGDFFSKLLVVCAEEDLVPRVFETYSPADVETLDSFDNQLATKTEEYVTSPNQSQRQHLVDEIISLEVKKDLHRNRRICERIEAMPPGERRLFLLGSYHLGVPQYFNANTPHSKYGAKDIQVATPLSKAMTKLLRNPSIELTQEEKMVIFEAYETNFSEYRKRANPQSPSMQP